MASRIQTRTSISASFFPHRRSTSQGPAWVLDAGWPPSGEAQGNAACDPPPPSHPSTQEQPEAAAGEAPPTHLQILLSSAPHPG